MGLWGEEPTPGDRIRSGDRSLGTDRERRSRSDTQNCTYRSLLSSVEVICRAFSAVLSYFRSLSRFWPSGMPVCEGRKRQAGLALKRWPVCPDSVNTITSVHVFTENEGGMSCRNSNSKMMLV